MIRGYLALADFAELDSGNRKVHILGAGWTMTAPASGSHAVVLFLRVPYDHVSNVIPISLRLVVKGGDVVELPAPGGRQRLEIVGQLQLEDPGENWDPAVDLDAVFPLNFGQLPLQAGTYTWIAEVDGKEVATADFLVRV